MILLLAGCSHARLAVPDASKVAAIEVTEGYGSLSGHVVSDHSKIQAAVNLVSDNNRGWTHAGITYPTPKDGAAFKSDDGSVLLVVWFGPGWIGAASYVGTSGGTLLWDLPLERQAELKRLLGVHD
jgi:hypothetical protein